MLIFALGAGSAAFYAMLVVAPRELAVREPDARIWLVRYAAFAVSAAIGAGGTILL